MERQDQHFEFVGLALLKRKTEACLLVLQLDGTGILLVPMDRNVYIAIDTSSTRLKSVARLTILTMAANHPQPRMPPCPTKHGNDKASTLRSISALHCSPPTSGIITKP